MNLLRKIQTNWTRKQIYGFIERVLIVIVLFLFFLGCFCSCSPQKQLANILAKHPELKRDSALTIDKYYTVPEETDHTTFTINDLLALTDSLQHALDSLQQIHDADLDPAENITHPSPHAICAETSGSSACITANADGSFNLNLTQKPDTIHVIDTINVPVYFTDTQYVDKEVYKMTPWQSFFYRIGCLIFWVTAIILLLFLLSRIFNYQKTY